MRAIGRGRCREAGQPAFTLTELLVALGIVALLAAILLPLLSSARKNGRETACLSNIRQLAMALTMYAQDSDGYFPTHPTIATTGPVLDWDQKIQPYAKAPDVFRCPDCVTPREIDSNPDLVSRGYALNGSISGANDGSLPSALDESVQFPASTVVLCEVGFTMGPEPRSVTVVKVTDAPENISDLSPGVTRLGPPGGLRHRGGSNYGFADGHAHWYRPEQVTAGGTFNGNKVVNTGAGPSFAL